MSALPDQKPVPATAIEAYREQLQREKLRRKSVSAGPKKRRKSVAKIEVTSVEVAEVEAAERRRLARESVSEVERRVKERVRSFLAARECLKKGMPTA